MIRIVTTICSVVLIWTIAVMTPVVAQAEEQQTQEEAADEEQIEEVPAGLFGEEPNPEDVPTIGFGDWESSIDESRELLAQNFSDLLDREPLGFDADLFEALADDIEGVISAATDPASREAAAFVNLAVVLIVLAVFLALFFLIDLQTGRLTHRLQAQTHFDSSGWLTTGTRKLILVAGRSAVFVVLLVLSFFPVRAVFGATGWTLLLTDALVLFLAYRVFKTLLVTTLRLHPPSAKARQHYAHLERFGLVVLQIVVGFLLALAAIERFEYHDQMAAFASFAFRLTLAVSALYLFRLRDAVLALLPAESSSGLYLSLRRTLANHYFTVVAISAALMLFNAAGYISAATFLLTRGYALLVVGVIWFVTLERLHEFVTRRAEAAEESDDLPSPLWETLEHWLIVVGSIALIAIALRLVSLYEPLMALLNIPLVVIGHLELSPLSLLSVVLIVVITVLSVRLFKALLNAKVYPAFDVDIGVAYATNTLINYALVVVAFLLCLIALGVQLSAVLVVMASLGVGIGFGLQNIAENLVSGFILLFGRAVQKGDFITVNDLYGRVEAVGARSVVVRTPDNFSMLVPSKEIVSGRIVNWTFQDSLVRLHIPVGVSYEADASRVRQILLDTAERHPDLLKEPEPDVWIVEFGDSSIVFELLVYFDCRTTNERALKGKFNFLIWEALQEAGIEIPYPQRDLHLRSYGDGDSEDPPRPASDEQ